MVFTGDFITGTSNRVFDELSRVLRAWPIGEFGTVAIMGNHDYGIRWDRPDVAAKVERCAADAGIHLLRNGRTDVRGLEIIGIDDLWSPRFDPWAVLSGSPANRAKIILGHNPDVVDHPRWPKQRVWVLAGHTHGRQCKPPFLPPPLLPIRNERYAAGEIDLKQRGRMYVNRGLWHLLRVRFNVRPEVTVFELRRT